MTKQIINDRKMIKLLDGGMSQAEVARQFGVTRQAISLRVKELRGKTTRAVVASKVEKVVDQKIDAISQIEKINAYANEMLDLLMAWQRGDEAALQVLESQVHTKKVRVGDEEMEVQQFKFKDPRELILKTMAEIRGQLKLQLELFQALFSLQAAQEFQETILQVIGEVDPNVRAEILHRLNKARAVRSALRYS